MLAALADMLIMDRRRELRVTSDQKVDVTELGPNRREMEGIAINMSGRGISIFVTDPFSPGDPVRLEFDDALLLGEVCYCRPQNEGFVVGIEIDQALEGLAELERFNRSLLGAPEVSYSMSEQA